MKKLLLGLFGIAAIGSKVQLKDSVEEFGLYAGTTMSVTGYCRYFHRFGYRLDGHNGAIYLREDFKVTS